jgi:hypothetical protein
MAYTTINKGSSYFNTVTYSGNSSNQTITVGFQPDFIWTKRRNASYSNELQDIVRGVTKVNYSDNLAAEDTVSQNIQSFNSTGYVQGSNPGVNETGGTYVVWNWLASNTTTSNTSGTITSTVSANPTAGFSVVGWTGNGTNGATVGHGLGVTPKMFIIKNRTTTTAWLIEHIGLPGAPTANSSTLTLGNSNTNGMVLFSNGAAITYSFDSQINGSGNPMIAYCFADVKGYSKFGSYTGNGSDDGTFVYTGFKPSFILIKNSTTGGTNWILHDNKRNTFNVVNLALSPTLNSAETDFSTSLNTLDFVSNGFKLRQSYQDQNTSGNNYIYMAFAENPFVSSTSVPTTAR